MTSRRVLRECLLLFGVLSFAPLQAELSDGLKLYLPLTGNAQDYGAHQYKTLQSGANLTSDRFGYSTQAYDFSSQTDFIQVQGDDALGVGREDFALNLWLKPDLAALALTPTDLNTFLELHSRDRFSLCCYFQAGLALALDHAGQLQVMLMSPQGAAAGVAACPTEACALYPSGVFLNEARWYHLLLNVDRDDPQGLRIFLDNQLQAQLDPSAYPLLSTEPQADLSGTRSSSLSLGRGITHFGDNRQIPYFVGSLDEVALFGRQLNREEITALFSQPLDAPALPQQPARPGQLYNISARGWVGGNEVLIAGFIIQHQPQKVLMVVNGGSLRAMGLQTVVLDPLLSVYQGSKVLFSNDNWQDSPERSAIEATGIVPQDPLEAALLVELPPGEYTAVVHSKGNSGTALLSVFNVTSVH